jgi:hypothetical protein
MKVPVIPSTVSPIGVSGAMIQAPAIFYPQLPSTWPPVPINPTAEFVAVWDALFNRGMLMEIDNVYNDVADRNAGSLSGRGHVLALAMMCALDSLSQFAFVGERQHVRIAGFIEEYFPQEFRSIAAEINDHYRNGLVHEWFMTAVAFEPEDEPIRREQNGSIVMGLRTFKNGLDAAVIEFLAKLRIDDELRRTAAIRYGSIQSRSRP